MTNPPEPADPPSPSDGAPSEPAPARRSYAPYFLKGCGWTLLSVFLGLGVWIAGHGNFEVVGSALAGIVILLLVLSSSGLTGFWDTKE